MDSKRKVKAAWDSLKSCRTRKATQAIEEDSPSDGEDEEEYDDDVEVAGAMPGFTHVLGSFASLGLPRATPLSGSKSKMKRREPPVDDDLFKKFVAFLASLTA